MIATMVREHAPMESVTANQAGNYMTVLVIFLLPLFTMSEYSIHLERVIFFKSHFLNISGFSVKMINFFEYELALLVAFKGESIW